MLIPWSIWCRVAFFFLVCNVVRVVWGLTTGDDENVVKCLITAVFDCCFVVYSARKADEDEDQDDDDDDGEMRRIDDREPGQDKGRDPLPHSTRTA